MGAAALPGATTTAAGSARDTATASAFLCCACAEWPLLQCTTLATEERYIIKTYVQHPTLQIALLAYGRLHKVPGAARSHTELAADTNLVVQFYPLTCAHVTVNMSGMFFRGTAAGQDHRFADKQAAQLKAIDSTAPPEYSTKVCARA